MLDLACACLAEGDLPDKADLIVSEIVDSQLIGEGILPTMRHATKYLLKVWFRTPKHLVEPNAYH